MSESRPTKYPGIRLYAQREAEKRGLRDEKASDWVEAFMESHALGVEASLRRAAGEPAPPEAEGWVYATAPVRPEMVDWSESGKWLVHCSFPYYEEVWGKLKVATEAGELGFLSKIRNPENPMVRMERSLVACVYTYDYEDLADVRRVLVALRELGFVRETLRYKRDADTLAGNYGSGSATYISPSGTRDFQPVERPDPSSDLT